MYSFDTEDDSKGNVHIIDFYDGMRHLSFVGKDCQAQAINWIFKFSQGKGDVDFFATNLEYDLINLFGVWYVKLLDLWYTKGGLIRARLGRIRFFDTLRNWEMSVAAAGEYISLPKLEYAPENLEYCKRDAEITYGLADTMLQRYKQIGLVLKSTISSTAFNFWLKNFCKCPIYLDKHFRKYVYGSNYGGRTEIFRQGLVHGNLFNYDINSSYPYAMLNGTFPDLRTARVGRKIDLKKCGLVRCTIHHPEMHLGMLPFRMYGKLLFPVGEFSGLWTNLELANAIEHGAYTSDIIYTVTFDNIDNPFSDFITYIYDQRVNSTDKFMQYLYKKLMNCVYGKFSEGGYIEIWKQGKIEVKTTVPYWSNIIFSSLILAHGRVNLFKYLESCGTDLCYCDTDSIITLNKVFKTGSGLGELKLKGTATAGLFVLPKLYSFGGEVFAKGVPKRFACEFITNKRITYEEPVRFRESVRQHVQPNVWVQKTKTMCKKYDKRIVIKGGQTKPLTF